MAKRKAPLHHLRLRQVATEATERHFRDRIWRPGSVDCAMLAAFHLKRFGWKLPKFERYRTVEQGREQMARIGASNMAELLDVIGLERIPPARALTGDMLFMPGEGEFADLGALVIASGPDTVKGFFGDQDGLVTMRANLVTAAWSVVRADG